MPWYRTTSQINTGSGSTNSGYSGENLAITTCIDGVNNLDILANGFLLTDIERIEALRGRKEHCSAEIPRMK
ncbi:MAG: hypothetical protein AAFX57_05405 [Bacteroidota bacterium]